jgi:ubiquinone/menaquinone biosynthesis C-methylase UbiE
MDILAPYREKWREVPGGDDNSGRLFSTDLLAMPDAELLSFWEANAAKRVAGSLSWLGPVYRDFFTGRRVLELGSGLGYDGLRFAAQGAHWTFADIAPENLKLIERVASLKGLSIKTFLIGDDLSFDALGGRYDAVLASGSIHHVPFEMARAECLSVLRRLKPGGRWIELAYTKERWVRDGSPPFDQWGKATDGDRTPWAEWYDADKLRARLGPATFSTVLDFSFYDDNFRWFDFIYAPDPSQQPLWPPKPTFGQRLRAARAAMSDWSYVNRIVGAGRKKA